MEKIQTITQENVERTNEIRKKEYLDKYSHLSQYLAIQIFPCSPELSFHVVVNGLPISELVFKEEYKTIGIAYNSVIEKLKEHYKLKKENYNGKTI